MAIGFTDIKGVLHADEVSLNDIAAKYGTPTYVYSASKIKDTVRRLQTSFAKALPAQNQPLIAFACKANSNIAVLKLMSGMGLGADIVSFGEMARAVKAGIHPQKIIFSGVGKTDDEILAALDAGILQINAESRPELERIAALAAKAGKKAPVSLRFNPDVDAKTHAKITTGKTENKFGMPLAEILPLYEWAAKQPSLRPRGFSVHIGSQLTTVDPFRQAFGKLAELAKTVLSKGLPLESLDLGGGLGVTYDTETPPDLDAYAAIVKELIVPFGVQTIFEPGRLLVGEAGLLLTKVIYVKQGENRRYLIVDAGMNDLIRPALYDAYHPIRPVDAGTKRAISKYDVVGPICETGDTFAKEREMLEMRDGELAAIMVAGAYGFVMASNYNTKPMAAEVLVDGQRHALVRQRQSVQDILEKESIPGWLT
jgi:diaminopimelate decarboxylase